MNWQDARVFRGCEPLSPAFALIAATAQFPVDATTVERVHEAASLIEDWREPLELAARHRISSLVAHGVAYAGIALPTFEANALATAARADVIGEAIHAGETRRLVRLLELAEIRPVVLKGMATALLAFGRLGLRTSRDVDLLVSADQVSAAAELIEAEGYTRIEPPTGISGVKLASWRRTHKDMVFLDPVRNVIVELHWRLFDNPHLAAALNEQTAVRQQFGNANFEGLPLVEHIVYLCLHGCEHAWSRLKWLADVNALLAVRDSDLQARLLAYATSIGAPRAVVLAIILCGHVFGLNVATCVAKLAEKDGAMPWLARIAIEALAAGGTIELEERAFGSTPKNLGHYLLVSGWRYRWAELAFDLRDVSAAPVPPIWRWLGPVGRVAHWGWRHISR